jgi:predicted acyltransferase
MTTKTNRLLSLDTLRGFDMFFISGGGTFLVLLKGKTGITYIDAFADQLEHVPWHGFVFYDFIFPLFLFIAGVSLSFSLAKGLAVGLTKMALYKKMFIRMLILIGLGILYKNSPVPFFEPSDIRLGSVLGRIGLACFLTSLLYMNFSKIKRIYWISGILISYYAALFLVPVPGYGAGDLSFEGNLTGWFDRTFLPGRLLQGTYDELGLLTQLPALCLTVFGSIAGDILRNENYSQNKKTGILVFIGIAAVLIGLLWNLHLPINKRLWSSSFILLTSGLSFLILALFYWVIDVKGFRKWTFFFKVIGLNSLTIYFAYRFIDFSFTSSALFGGLYAPLSEEWQGVCDALGALFLVWLSLYLLYRLKIFIKI